MEALAVPVAAEGRGPAARADHLDVERAQRRQDALDGVAHDGHDAAAAQQERLDGGVRRLRPVPRVRAAVPPAAGSVAEPLELASGQRGVRRDGAALGRHAQRHGRARAVDDAQAAKTSAGRKAQEPRRSSWSPRTLWLRTRSRLRRAQASAAARAAASISWASAIVIVNTHHRRIYMYMLARAGLP